MRRPATLAVALAVALAGCGGGDDGPSRVPVAWVVGAVSEDARTVTIRFADSCGGRPEGVEVDESATAVEIALTRAGADPDTACTLELRVEQREVRLSRPVGQRVLVAPDDVSDREVRVLRDQLPARELSCDVLATYASDAPAFDVGRVADRWEDCSAPAPTELRRFPLLRRPASAADRLPAGYVPQAEPDVVLHAEQRRGVRRPFAAWLSPGPLVACLETTSAGVCRDADEVAERGIFLGDCDELRGVAPRSRARVELLAGERRVGRARADANGVFVVRGPRATHIAIDGTREQLRGLLC